MYALNEETFQRFLAFMVPEFKLTAGEVLNNVAPILQLLFLFRIINSTGSFKYELIKWDGCCDCQGAMISFNEEEYIHRTLNRNARLIEKESFLQSYHSLREQCHADIRHFADGHDFIDVFTWYARRATRNVNLNNNLLLHRSLLLSIDPQDLMSEPLFRELVARFTSAPSSNGRSEQH
jgi:hypothetical protein